MPTKRYDGLDPDRKRTLLAAAAAEFAAHGYEGASFNRIVERAGTSKGGLYYYFEDKADLYATVIRDALVRFVDHLGPLPPAHDIESFWASIRAFSRAALRYYAQDPHIAGLVRSLAAGGLGAVPVAAIRATYTSWFAALVETGQALGAVRTDLPVSLQIAVAASVSEGFDVWLAEHLDQLDDDELDRLAATITDLYRRMAAPDPLVSPER